MNPRILTTCLAAALATSVAAAPASAPAPAPRVVIERLPAGAIQPAAAVDDRGVLHVVYYRNGPKEGTGDLFYVRRQRAADGRETTSEPVRVNSRPGTAGCIGTVRAAQIAMGRGGRVFVVWNGLGPIAANGYPTAYQAFTRLNDAGTAFEPQRDLITWARGVDGGGTVAADRGGRVYVAWHALAGAKDEAGAAVYLAVSGDDGRTFARELRASPPELGACGCCGMRAAVDAAGALYLEYRTAADRVQRDTELLVSHDHGLTYSRSALDPWRIDACPMSTFALTPAGGAVVAAWETEGRVRWRTADAAFSGTAPLPPAHSADQKHPTVAVNRAGDVLVAWTEGTGWQRGGSLAWQVYDPTGAPVGPVGRAPGVPVWGLASAVATPDASFTIVY